MKRVVWLIAIVLVIFVVFHGNAEILRHVVDNANVLTSAQVLSLEEQAQSVYDAQGFDIVLLTTKDSLGKSAQMYAADFYDDFRSPLAYRDGVIFAVLFDIREYYEAARGSGIEHLTSQGEGALGNVVASKLTNKEYFSAFQSYIALVKDAVTPDSPIETTVSLFPFIAIAGLIIGLVYALILKSKLKIASFQRGANSYVLPGSLNITESNDIFLYQTVTRTRIQTNSGGSGGGGTFRSSGGTSYGGRGGKF